MPGINQTRQPNISSNVDSRSSENDIIMNGTYASKARKQTMHPPIIRPPYIALNLRLDLLTKRSKEMHATGIPTMNKAPEKYFIL